MQQHRSNGWEERQVSKAKAKEILNQGCAVVIDKNRYTSGDESIQQQ